MERIDRIVPESTGVVIGVLWIVTARSRVTSFSPHREKDDLVLKSIFANANREF